MKKKQRKNQKKSNVDSYYYEDFLTKKQIPRFRTDLLKPKPKIEMRRTIPESYTDRMDRNMLHTIREADARLLTRRNFGFWAMLVGNVMWMFGMIMWSGDLYVKAFFIGWFTFIMGLQAILS